MQPLTLRERLVARFRDLRGDPHYIAMGMAIGVFTGVTPTFPLHTLLAIFLAIVLRGSKRAATLGVWFGNPVTMPIFYYGSYRAGSALLGRPLGLELHEGSWGELLRIGADVGGAMLAGGAIIAAVPAVLAYVVTYHCVKKYRQYNS